MGQLQDTNSLLLSKGMLDSETALVYSTTFTMSSNSASHFTLSSSQSQGFSWNQDLFASQYQQMCKVVYDGHEDTLEKLISKLQSCIATFERRQSYNDVNYFSEVFDEDEEAEELQDSGYVLHHRLSDEINRPRRRSERSISFVSDSKNGSYRKTDTIVIDVEEDTPENKHLRSLV